MPTKFKPSVVIAEKQSNGTIKKRNQHFYMKHTSTKVIVEMYEKSNTLSKIKDKTFVYDEEKIKTMSVLELTTVLQQELTDPQTKFILKILKEKKKANKQGTN